MNHIENEIICPHCKNNIEISAILKERLSQKVYSEIANELEKNIKKNFEKENMLNLEKNKAKIENDLKNEYRDTLKILENKIDKSNLLVKELRSDNTTLQMEKLEQENHINKLKDEKNLTINVAVNKALEKQKSEVDNIVYEKDLTIDGLKKSIIKLERQSRQSSVQIQGEAGELLIEKNLENEFPYDSIQEIKKGQAGADCLLKVKNRIGNISGSIYFEAKRTKEFSFSWIEKLKKDSLNLNADISVLVTEKMPNERDDPHIIDGIWVTHFSDFLNVTKVLRYGLLNISRLKKAESLRKDKAQIMFDYLISKKFADTLDTIISPIIKMSGQLEKEKNAITKQWSIREKSIEQIIKNANIFHGHLVSISDGNLPLVNSLKSIDEI